MHDRNCRVCSRVLNASRTGAIVHSMRGNLFEHVEINKRCMSCLLKNSGRLSFEPAQQRQKARFRSAFFGSSFREKW